MPITSEWLEREKMADVPDRGYDDTGMSSEGFLDWSELVPDLAKLIDKSATTDLIDRYTTQYSPQTASDLLKKTRHPRSILDAQEREWLVSMLPFFSQDLTVRFSFEISYVYIENPSKGSTCVIFAQDETLHAADRLMYVLEDALYLMFAEWSLHGDHWKETRQFLCDLATKLL